jgi:hypothetical protein
MTTPIFNKNFSDADKELSIKDMEVVHSIRGRIIHIGSILENLIRLVVTKDLYETYKNSLQIKSNYNHLSFLDNLRIFVEENKQIDQITDFKHKAEKLWSLYRNVFAHGFVYYERFETDKKDEKYKPLNHIVSFNQKSGRFEFMPIHYNTEYFNIANIEFKFVIEWLEKNKFIDKLREIL